MQRLGEQQPWKAEGISRSTWYLRRSGMQGIHLDLDEDTLKEVAAFAKEQKITQVAAIRLLIEWGLEEVT